MYSAHPKNFPDIYPVDIISDFFGHKAFVYQIGSCRSSCNDIIYVATEFQVILNGDTQVLSSFYSKYWIAFNVVGHICNRII